jgi:hypothetical protein
MVSAVASGTSQRGHAASIFTPKLGRSDRHIHNGFMDEHLFIAGRAALEVCLRRRATRFVEGFQRERLVALATPIAPFA